MERTFTVLKWRDGQQVTVGKVIAANLQLANTKAQRLFGSRAWATGV